MGDACLDQIWSSSRSALVMLLVTEMHLPSLLCRYRLVPDVHFPVPFDDVLRATKHFMLPDVLAQYSVDPNRVAISGDSAGGNLAAAVCQEVKTVSRVQAVLRGLPFGCFFRRLWEEATYLTNNGQGVRSSWWISLRAPTPPTHTT